MSEKTRNHPRVAQATGVELRSGTLVAQCRARDLSLAGCYLETAQEVAGEIVDLVFVGSEEDQVARCQAQILRRDREADGRRGLAVRFLSLGWGDLFGLARLLAPGLGVG